VPHQVAEGGVDRALALQSVQAGEGFRLYLHREVRFAAAVVAGVAAVPGAVVDDFEARRIEGLDQPFRDFRGDWAGECIAHSDYIGRLDREGIGLASSGKRQSRFHGRVEGRAQPCAHPGCEATGEFRAPPSDGRRANFDGPGDWRWLCLDHVRAFNDRYNYFAGMSSEEISEAQNPYGGWDRETRAFASFGDRPPRWADFTDPLDAIGARFQRAASDAPRKDGRELSQADRKSLSVLGLGTDADRRALRRRYAELVRRYHPDRNGGDRSHEKALQAVIEAYTALKSRPAFA
jgi:hypothetical protein